MMLITPMEIKDVKQIAERHNINSAVLVPYEHETRKDSEGAPAIWYRVVVELDIKSKTADAQLIALATSRKTLRQFANVGKALEFIDDHLNGTQFERVAVIRTLNNEYNPILQTMFSNPFLFS